MYRVPTIRPCRIIVTLNVIFFFFLSIPNSRFSISDNYYNLNIWNSFQGFGTVIRGKPVGTELLIDALSIYRFLFCLSTSEPVFFFLFYRQTTGVVTVTVHGRAIEPDERFPHTRTSADHSYIIRGR